MHRLSVIVSHLRTNESVHFQNPVASEQKEKESTDVVDADGLITLSLAQDPSNPIRWDGWGYRDTGFQLTPQGSIRLDGSRYLFSGKVLPNLRKWFEDKVGLDISFTSPSQPHPRVPPSIHNEAFISEIKGQYKQINFSHQDRLFHGHGHTCQELYMLRFGRVPRIPDVVIYPGSHEHVEAIVAAAVKHNIGIIPYGGGTSVSQALLCPENEKRMIVSLDMHRMCNIKWVNKESMLACIEAGAVGVDIERKLNSYGVCLGHEPDSVEFSTLGGWISTRASGMRKNNYGNIEDIVRRVTLVTPTGTMVKHVTVPRMSAGPDINQIILGSEGILGVITEAIVRISNRPKMTKYGSIVFPNFELGAKCMEEITKQKCAPVSIRLVDNIQFQFGQALKPENHDWKENLKGKISKWYVLNHLKFDADVMVAATLLFEGTPEDIAMREKKCYAIAKKYGGIKGGEENGIRGYFLTYMIAYLRDFGFEYSFLAESFETSVPWDSVIPLCKNVKLRIALAAKDRGVKGDPFVSCRVTQGYDTGACIYFYYGFVWRGVEDPVRVFSEVEHEARDEILKNGGSISHHHGVGKLRKDWMEETQSPAGMALLKGIKHSLDPKNIFCAGNLI